MIALLEFVITGLYNLIMNFLDHIEATTPPGTATLYSSSKTALLTPLERIYDSAIKFWMSGFVLFDSLLMGVFPIIDGAILWLTMTVLLYCRLVVESWYHLEMFCLTFLQPFIDMLKTWVIVGDVIHGFEYALKYVLVEYYEVDFEEDDAVFDAPADPPKKVAQSSPINKKDRQIFIRPEAEVLSAD